MLKIYNLLKKKSPNQLKKKVEEKIVEDDKLQESKKTETVIDTKKSKKVKQEEIKETKETKVLVKTKNMVLTGQ